MSRFTLLKNEDNAIQSVLPKGRFLLEIIRKQNAPDEGLRYTLYQPETNTVEEIGKGLFLTPYVEIQNAIWESEDFYYPAYSDLENGRFRIDLYKYDTRSHTGEVIYSFEDEGRLSEKGKRFKIFLLSENALLVQREILDTSKKEVLMGHIQFEQKLVDKESGEETIVKDENLNNNGLNRIIAISPTQILTKTGYSYAEDSRFSSRSETDALIESIFIHTTSRFIADLAIGATTIDAYLLSSAYYHQYILTPQFTGDYIYYMIIDPEEGSSVSHFYNVITNEQLSCKNEMLDMEDLQIGFVIANTPYVKNAAMTETRFLNLKTMDFDLSVMGEEFVEIIGDLFILKNRRDHRESMLNFYHYPDMKRVLQEKGETVIGCKKDENYYLYLYKK